jgi:hypothetical protein
MPGNRHQTTSIMGAVPGAPARCGDGSDSWGAGARQDYYPGREHPVPAGNGAAPFVAYAPRRGYDSDAFACAFSMMGPYIVA